LISAGKFNLPLSQTFGLDDVADAHRSARPDTFAASSS
jgi:hypothetical protein